MRRFLLLLCFALPALAVDWKAYKNEGYVSDFARVIDPQSKAELESYAARVQEATGAQMAFVTVPSLQGEPIEDVTNDIFHNWGVGEKTKDNGMMVLLSVGDRKSRLEVGGGLGEFIPDSMAGLLLEDMRPALRQNQFGTAFLLAAQRLGGTLAEAQGKQISPPAIPRRVERSAPDRIPWPLIMIGLFFLLMFLRRGGGGHYGGGGGGSGFWTGLLLSQVLNSGGRRNWSGGGGDGGGFGGFDSGGSGGGFGGFGGGDSGGGGASSDW